MIIVVAENRWSGSYEAERLHPEPQIADKESETETEKGFSKFRDTVPPARPSLLQIRPHLLHQGHFSQSFQNRTTP